MGNYHDTLLECKSNPQLLTKIDPRDIIKKTDSEFITCKDCVYYFQTHRSALFYDIVELSKKYPNEIFETRIWNVDADASVIRTIRYENGEVELLKTEPNYSYFASHIIKTMGKETFEKLINVAMIYIRKIDELYSIQDFDNELEQEAKDHISSFVTVRVENEEFRIDVTKRTYSSLEVVGYIKHASPAWELIEHEKIQKIRNKHPDEHIDHDSNSEEYEDLPF